MVADLHDTSWTVVFNKKVPVKLQEGGFVNGGISDIPFERALLGFERLSMLAKEKNAKKIYAFATSAVREARNGDDLVNQVYDRTKVKINVIDGKKEADLIKKGVLQTVKLESPSLIMDIGGGSTEFIIADGQTTYWQKSFRLGVSHLFEKLRPSDPMTKEDIDKLNAEFDLQLSSLKEALALYPCQLLIGSSGSFDSLVDMIEYKWGSLEKGMLARPILMNHFNFLYRFLIKSKKEERQAVPGLKPIRAEFIVISMIFIQYVIENLGLNNLYQSEYALKEGVIKELQQKNPLWNNT